MHIAPGWEVLLYLSVIGFLQIKIFLHGWHFSHEVSQRVQLPGLHPGWLPGLLKVDLSDAQWRDFRGSLPLLAVAFAAFLVLSHGVKLFQGNNSRRTLFYAFVSTVFLGALHGCCLLHITVLSLLHFVLTKSLAGSRAGILVVWACACAAFILVRVTEGLPFASISPALAALDSHRGILRWHIHYNLLLLRMLSFSSDMHWARVAARGQGQRPVDGAAHKDDKNLKARTQQHLPVEMYSLVQYWVYLMYPPLYIAGPIVTFNSFVSQLVVPQPLKAKQVLQYALRWLLLLLSLELLTHTLHFNSIAKYRAWTYLEAAGLALAPLHYAEGSYWVLLFMWLKFSVIWRFFRLVSLADGFEVPENMTRCVCNNYDVEGFWRSWHASYNQWLVRYLYIPLGGARWRLLNVWIIFTFVALWHDLEWKLLGWAWIMALALAPEMGFKALGRSRWAAGMSHSSLWRHACAAAAAVNILLLMSGNMVGFVVGLDGLAPLALKILDDRLFVLCTLCTLFAAAQLMFALRAARSSGTGAGGQGLRAR